ncbi:MAG: YhbY family RNA-binding protein [Clostridia bacterium]|nr:YhbY family RNA-binding protein [Clostridia bacterium]
MTITSKQRSQLKAIAQTISPIGQIGKGGLNDNMIKSLNDALTAREIIKLSVLNNSEEDAIFLAKDLESALKCICVAVIGKKIILYRHSEKLAKQGKAIRLIKE